MNQTDQMKRQSKDLTPEVDWLEKNDMESGDGIPLGLILCAGKSSEQVELLELEQSGIRVAEYLTELPPRELLKKKLHQAIQSARRSLSTSLRHPRDAFTVQSSG